MSERRGRAVTVAQPLASLAACGALAWMPMPFAPDYRGPLALHAAPELPAWGRALLQRHEVLRLALKASGYSCMADLPLGDVVGVARLVDIHLAERLDADWMTPVDMAAIGEDRRCYVWQIEGARLIEEPIPCLGFGALWSVPDGVADLLNANL